MGVSGSQSACARNSQQAPACHQPTFCRAFFSRLGRRDLFFFGNFGILADFIRGADSPTASGPTGFFPAPFSASLVSLAGLPSTFFFFLSAILSSRPAKSRKSVYESSIF